MHSTVVLTNTVLVLLPTTSPVKHVQVRVYCYLFSMDIQVLLMLLGCNDVCWCPAQCQSNDEMMSVRVKSNTSGLIAGTGTSYHSRDILRVLVGLIFSQSFLV